MLTSALTVHITSALRWPKDQQAVVKLVQDYATNAVLKGFKDHQLLRDVRWFWPDRSTNHWKVADFFEAVLGAMYLDDAGAALPTTLARLYGELLTRPAIRTFAKADSFTLPSADQRAISLGLHQRFFGQKEAVDSLLQVGQSVFGPGFVALSDTNPSQFGALARALAVVLDRSVVDPLFTNPAIKYQSPYGLLPD
jgi:hypothetical protein